MPLLISIIYENATIYTRLISLTLASLSPLLFSSPLATEKKLDQHRRQSSTSPITTDRACRTIVYLSKKSCPPVFPFICTEKVELPIKGKQRKQSNEKGEGGAQRRRGLSAHGMKREKERERKRGRKSE
ncbi:hypothetical protein ACSBR2_023257 [Camellia fascicularis]